MANDPQYSEAYHMGWRSAVFGPCKNPFLESSSRADWDAGFADRTAIEDDHENQRRWAD